MRRQMVTTMFYKLGYCALTQKIREIHGQKLLRNLVYAMMEHVDPSGLRKLGGKSQRVFLPQR